MNYQLFFSVVYRKIRKLKEEEIITRDVIYDILLGLNTPNFSVW